MAPKPDSQLPPAAQAADVRRILGELDEDKLMAVLDLEPSVADLELAAQWLGGDPDVFGAGEPIKGVASSIVTLLTAEEDEELRAH